MKLDLNTFYNFTSFKNAQSNVEVDFKDNEAGTILARNLEVIDPTIFKQEYSGLTFLQSGVIANNIGGYAEVITKIKRKIVGNFTDGDDNDNGTGKISVAAEKDTIPVYYKEAFSAWTNMEIKQAEMENRNLVSEFIEGHTELYNRNIDEIGYVGQFYKDGTSKTTGLLNFSGFTATAAAGKIDTLTAEAAYNAIKDLITRRRVAAKGNTVLSPTNVVMPTRVYEYISGTIINTAGTSLSILETLESKYPNISFNATDKAEKIADGGQFLALSSTVCYSNNSRAMVMRIPTPLEIGEIIKPSSFKFRVDSFYRIAGLDVIENDAGEILTGL